MSPAMNVLRRVTRQRRGGVGVLAAMLCAALVGVGAVAVNHASLRHRSLVLRQSTQSAALAAAAQLPTYYTSGTQATAAITAAARTIATANMPVSTWGTVVPASSVVLGNWDATARTFTTLAQSGGTSPDAVQVTGTATAAHGNPLRGLMPGLGGGNRDVQTMAIARSGTGQPWHAIVTNDLSKSTNTYYPAADKAVLDCVRSSAGSPSRFGLTLHTSSALVFQPLSIARPNYAALTAKIDSMKSCGASGLASCTGSNVAAAIYSARQQFADAAYNGSRKNIVIIADGLPNATSSYTYTRADGIFPTDTATTPTCTNCSDANLWTMAINQAALARAAGISISTIFFSGGTSSALRHTYATHLAQLSGGTGVALVSPTTDQITRTFAGFCATTSSTLTAEY